MNQASAPPLQIDFDYVNKVEEESGIKVSVCYQCRKCTNGCPLTFSMDWYPDQIIRFVLLGQEQRVLNSATIWVCSSCETCTTRCPNEIDIAGIMDYLKQQAARKGIVDPARNRTMAFHRIFLRDIERRGRVHEAALMNEYMLTTGAWRDKWRDGTLMEELKLGWSLFRKGRMRIKPQGVSNPREIKKLFRESGTNQPA